MGRSILILIICMLQNYLSPAQISPVDRQLFFLDDRTIETTLTLDIRKLRNDKNNPNFLASKIVMHFSDTSVISGDVGIKPRGIYRKENCEMASLLLNFKKTSSPLSSLKELKLVGGCHSNNADGNLLLKEYLAYKIYNFISPMSFRVRLLHVTYNDIKQKAKSYTQYAFLIEDLKDLAKRNNCVEIKKRNFGTEATNREQINVVSIFQYMIGNTDWAVPVRHNIKLIAPKNDTLASPYVIPYDFDYAGIVNAGYAVPSEGLDIKYVTQRLYRGFARNVGEVEQNVGLFKEKKEQIMFYIKNFPLLDAKDKKYVTGYLEDFFKIIEDKRACRSIFVENARKE